MSKPKPKPRTLEDTRLDLLGVDKPWRDRTKNQRALGRILLCRARYWLFDPDHADYARLCRDQMRYSELRGEFFLARSIDELLDISRTLVELEARLSGASTANALAGRHPESTAPLVGND